MKYKLYLAALINFAVILPIFSAILTPQQQFHFLKQTYDESINKPQQRAEYASLLGNMHISGVISPETAREYHLEAYKLAEQCRLQDIQIRAASGLGWLYLTGRLGVDEEDETNYFLAFRYCHEAYKSAKQHDISFFHEKSACDLGLIYRFGLGVEQNYQKASAYLEEARIEAEKHGNYQVAALACVDLGLSTLEDIENRSNPKQAYKKIRKIVNDAGSLIKKYSTSTEAFEMELAVLNKNLNHLQMKLLGHQISTVLAQASPDLAHVLNLLKEVLALPMLNMQMKKDAEAWAKKINEINEINKHAEHDDIASSEVTSELHYIAEEAAKVTQSLPEQGDSQALKERKHKQKARRILDEFYKSSTAYSLEQKYNLLGGAETEAYLSRDESLKAEIAAVRESLEDEVAQQAVSEDEEKEFKEGVHGSEGIMRSVTAGEVEKVLFSSKFERSRKTGSHAIYKKDGRTVVVPFHAQKPLKAGTFKSILKQAGFEQKEFNTKLDAI